MFNGNYTKIDTILPTIRKYPFAEGITKREAAHGLIGLLQLVGATVPLIRKYENIEIISHKGELPKDIMYIHGVNYKGDSCDNQGVAMRYASDIYNSALHSEEAKKVACGTSTTGVPLTPVSPGDTKTVGEVGQVIAPINYGNDAQAVSYENSYNINGMSIDIAAPNGWVEICYDSVNTDEEGYPMIPDNQSLKEAFKYFLLKNAAEPAFYRGDVQQYVWNDINTQYNWYVGQSFSSLTMLSPDQMNSLANGLIRILPSKDNYQDGWKSFNKPR